MLWLWVFMVNGGSFMGPSFLSAAGGFQQFSKYTILFLHALAEPLKPEESTKYTTLSKYICRTSKHDSKLHYILFYTLCQ